MIFVFFLCFLLPRGKNHLIFTSDKCQLVLCSPQWPAQAFRLLVMPGLPRHLLLLQHLGWVGAGGSEGLPEDSKEGYDE